MSRTNILLSEYGGVSFIIIERFLYWCGYSCFIYSFNETGMALVIYRWCFNLVFTSIAFFASVKARDKARGIGAALLLWFYFALIYDGLILADPF